MRRERQVKPSDLSFMQPFGWKDIHKHSFADTKPIKLDLQDWRISDGSWELPNDAAKPPDLLNERVVKHEENDQAYFWKTYWTVLLQVYVNVVQ